MQGFNSNSKKNYGTEFDLYPKQLIRKVLNTNRKKNSSPEFSFQARQMEDFNPNLKKKLWS